MKDNSASRDARAIAPSNYAPRWTSYASRILDGLFDGTRSRGDDQTTRKVMLTCLQTLAKGLALSDKQKAAFIDNIRIRLGKLEFAWDGPIQLTRSQIPGAQNLLLRLATELLQCGSAAIEQDSAELIENLSARVCALEQTVAQLLGTIGSEPAAKQLTSCSNAAKSSAEPAETLDFPGATERNETKRNHEEPMILSLEPMTTMTGPVAPPSAANDISPSTGEIHESTAMEVDSDCRGAKRAVVSYFRNNPDGPPSAILEYAGKRFALVFQSADVAEDKLYTVSSPEWRSEFDHAIGSSLRDQSRQNHQSDLRYVISPLYDPSDTYGKRKPVIQNCAAVLLWNDDGQPKSIGIIDGDTGTLIPLSPTKLTKPKSPTHKGSVSLAA